MLDFSHLPGAETFYFEGAIRQPATTHPPITWNKPRGKTMIHIVAVGGGGNGGNGSIGTTSTSAGGGGGSSGSMSVVMMPLVLLPDTLYIKLNNLGMTDAVVSITQDGASSANIVFASTGNDGGNASGGTAGTAGSATSAASATTMRVGWMYAKTLGGMAGTAGSGVASGVSGTVPNTGLIVTGGTGGGGIGNYGGDITGDSASLPTLLAGVVAPDAFSPAGNGKEGIRGVEGFMFNYGGTGAGGTRDAASGNGLIAGNGGNGAPGCGGGGGGASFTGSTQGLGGLGGPAFCLITVW